MIVVSVKKDTGHLKRSGNHETQDAYDDLDWNIFLLVSLLCFDIIDANWKSKEDYREDYQNELNSVLENMIHYQNKLQELLNDQILITESIIAAYTELEDLYQRVNPDEEYDFSKIDLNQLIHNYPSEIERIEMLFGQISDYKKKQDDLDQRIRTMEQNLDDLENARMDIKDKLNDLNNL